MRFEKKKSDCLYNKNSSHRKLVEAIIKSDGLRWMKYTDDLGRNLSNSGNTWLAL
jgi:hypothetical protein